MRICSVCGERNEDWMDICQRCGRSIVNADVDNTYDSSSSFDYDEYKVEEEKEEKKEKPKLFIANLDLKIILAILLVILFVLLLILFSMK